jgi:hypothetical protein
LFIGCLGNYPVSTSTTSNVTKISKEDKVKEGVSNHVKTSFAKIGAYKNVQFGELFLLKPKEILELDEMIEIKNQLPLQREIYGDNLQNVIDSQDIKIAYKKQEIQDKHIYPWYEINHLFAIVPVEKDSVGVYEYDFEVYPNYTIREAHQKLAVQLSKTQFKTFEKFMNKTPVYESEDYNWAYEMNSKFYTQCLAALEEENDYKDELLKTILNMMNYITVHNEFNEKDFALKVAKKWELLNMNTSLDDGEYSELSPLLSSIDDVEVISGYQIVRKFNDSTKDPYIFIFDLNFVLISVKQ